MYFLINLILYLYYFINKLQMDLARKMSRSEFNKLSDEEKKVRLKLQMSINGKKFREENKEKIKEQKKNIMKIIQNTIKNIEKKIKKK